MSIYKQSENYGNDQGRLRANAGDWVDGEVKFSQVISVGSGSTNKCFHSRPTSSTNLMSFQNFNWAQAGFSVGDVCDCRVVLLRGLSNTLSGPFVSVVSITQSITFTIAALNGNVATLTGFPVVSTAWIYPLQTQVGGSTVFPGTITDIAYGQGFVRYEYQGIIIKNTSRPDQIEFQFNLAPDTSNTLNSVIDGEVNKFVLNGVSSMGVNVPTPMIQSINKSGGYFKDVIFTKTGVFSDYSTDFKINFKFMQWGVIEDGFPEPQYYNVTDDLIPLSKINTITANGGANGLTSQSTGLDETGGFNEQYNGGINPFTVISTNWFDSLGNAISGLDYSGDSTFVSVINTNVQHTPNYRYRIGLVWRPEDSDPYLNKTTNLGSNLLVNAPEIDFAPTGVASPVIHIGEADSTGAKWDLTDIKFEILGNTIKVSGKVMPNNLANALFSLIPDGGRKSTLWISIGETPLLISLIPVVPLDRISLKLFDEDNIDAPTIGVQIPDILEEKMLDHDGNDVTNFTTSNTTTEDDMLYFSDFLLPDNVVYDGLRARISAYQFITGDEFILENRYISFANVVNQNGQLQPNITLPRGFNLPPTTDRNEISIKRKPSLDIAGKYGIRFEYGFLNDWRYWLSQSNVDNFFFDITEPLNGKNKNWQRFSSGKWKMRVSFFLDKAGIEDFNHQPFKIRPYEDDINVTTGVTITRLLTSTTISQLMKNELHEIQVVFNWNQNFTDEWVEFTIEDFESGNRWVISSVLAQGNINANPFKPITGDTRINVVGTGTNTLTCKALIDTNLVSANKVSLSYRVYSSPNENIPNPDAKQKTDGSYKQKTDGSIKIKA